MTEKKHRQLNYEALRILAMLMIVCLHYLDKGGLLSATTKENMCTSDYAAWLIEAFCLMAVNVYVLISGYFGGTSTGDANILKKPFTIWKQVIFYSAAIGALAMLFGVQDFDIYQVFTYIFPIVTEHYWFATSYIVLCLFMPFLNRGVKGLGKKSLERIIFAFLLIFCVTKTIIPMKLAWDNYGYDPFWFVTLYLTGAYIARYGLPFLEGKLASVKAAFLYIVCALATFASFLLLRKIYFATGSLEDFISYAYSYNHLLCYLGAIGLFMLFKSVRVSERLRKPVELAAGASFGVYLIHEHINIRYMWTGWFNTASYAGAPLAQFLVHMLLTVAVVYIVCTLIELVRQRMRARHILATILFFYPMRYAFTGVDLMDAGYSLGNYRFFSTMNSQWRLATYLSNVVGVLLSKLPRGGTWVGMNFYTGALVGAVAAFSYLYICKRFGERMKKAGIYVLFVAELAALSLCWAPSVILYHYLGYLIMTVAGIVLYAAIQCHDNKKHLLLITSGVLLGLCVAVRMPNITYMALILPLWYSCFIRKEKFGVLVKNTLCCIGGYAIGLAASLGFICFRYGAAAYPEMISWLFGMTDTATDYKPTSMLASMFGDYASYSVWLLLFVLYGLIGMLWFWITDVISRRSDKLRSIAPCISKASKVVYILGMAVLLRFCYGRGMFGVDYSSFFSMYKWLTVYLLMVIIGCVCILFSKAAEQEYKVWAVFLLVIIFITPLGSNNGLYPIINNLFLVAPMSVVLFWRLLEMLKGSARLKPDMRFALVGTVALVLICTAVQSALFGVCFHFHDNDEAGTGRAVVELKCTDVLSGVKTTQDKKAALEGLDDFLYESGLNGERVILYGNIPAISYIFDMEPAIFTTWADLESNGISQLTEDLDALYAEGETPLVIIGTQILEKDAKYEEIYAFAEKSGYETLYVNDMFEVWGCMAK